MIGTLTFQTLPPAPVKSVVWGTPKDGAQRFIAGLPRWPAARSSSEVGSPDLDACDCESTRGRGRG